MLWFFERNDESLKLETRYDNDTSELVAIVRYPDGREQTERFTELAACRKWLVDLENALEGEMDTQRPAGLPAGRLAGQTADVTYAFGGSNASPSTRFWQSRHIPWVQHKWSSG